jgi:hypothetical protein
LNALALLYKQTSDNKRLKEIKEIHKLPLFLFGAVCWIYFDSDRFIHSQSLSLKVSGFQSKWRTVYLFRVFFILFFTIPPRSSAFHHLIKVADISTIWADRTYPLEGKKRKIGRDLRCGLVTVKRNPIRYYRPLALPPTRT